MCIMKLTLNGISNCIFSYKMLQFWVLSPICDMIQFLAYVITLLLLPRDVNSIMYCVGGAIFVNEWTLYICHWMCVWPQAQHTHTIETPSQQNELHNMQMNKQHFYKLKRHWFWISIQTLMQQQYVCSVRCVTNILQKYTSNLWPVLTDPLMHAF